MHPALASGSSKVNLKHACFAISLMTKSGSGILDFTWRHCLAAFFALLCPVPSLGEVYNVRGWHTEDGLPSGQVTAIAQTPDGYLWVGTLRGLARFDGVRFRVFTATSTPSLGDSRITSLLTDCEGILWIGTADGNLVRRRGDRVEPVEPPVPFALEADKQSMPDFTSLIASIGGQSGLTADREGALWWHVHGKPPARLKDGRWTVFAPTNGLPEGASQLACDGEGRIWGTEDKQYRLYCFEDGQWDLPEHALQLSGYGPPALSPSSDGGLWVADPHGWSNPEPGRVQRLSGRQPRHSASFSDTRIIPPRTQVTMLLEDRNGRLWVATRDSGLCYFDAKGGWQHLEAQPDLGLARVTCLFEDSQGNIWVGTLEDGLHRVSLQPLTPIPLPVDSSMVWSICATRDDAVWVGTLGSGVLRLQAGKFTQMDGDWGAVVPEIQSLFEDSRTNLWAGTSKGVFRLEGERFRRVEPVTELTRPITAIFEDRSGCLWFGGYQDLFSLQENCLTAYSSKMHLDIRAIAEDNSGDLWIGTIQEGLYRLPRGQTRQLTKVPKYPVRDARSLFVGPDGTLWVGSQQSGLFRRSVTSSEDFVLSAGTLSDTIFSILNDHTSHLWMATGNGIIGVSTRTPITDSAGAGPPLLWKHLSLAEGLGHRRCYSKGQPGIARTSDGRLWFPNVDHLAVLDPKETFSRGSIYNVFVESLEADGKELPRVAGAAFRVPAGPRRFSFEYTALDLTAPTSLRFRYQLSGIDGDWVDAGPQRAAHYSRLPPGEYEFRVMAGSGDGLWREADQGVRLVVVPRIWERRWVQLLAMILLISVVGGSLAFWQRRRLQLKLERLEVKQKVENERTRISRDIHDDLGARLTQIMLVSELGQRNAGDLGEVGVNFTKIGRTSREAVQALDEIVWAVNPKNDNLPRLVRYICRFADECFEASGIRCWQNVPLDLPNLPVPAEHRHSLFCAVKEAMTNILKHSQATEVRLCITFAEDTLRVEIEDNGCGFTVSETDLSRSGLNNMSARLRESGGQTHLRSAPQRGTGVSFALPVQGLPAHGSSA